MERGIALNLFEVHLPASPIPIFSQPWHQKEDSLRELRKTLLPSLLHASNDNGKLYLYGSSSAQRAEEQGFTPDFFEPDSDPRFTGTLLIDAVIHHLTSILGFELQLRPHVSKQYEVTDKGNLLQRLDRRIAVYPSYQIQSMFLRVGDELHYFLLVKPKTRYRFVHSLQKIQESVDCMGRFVKVACPSDCDVYDCALFEYKGRLAGKFIGMTDVSSFQCRFHLTGSSNTQFVQFDERSRFSFPIPIEVCELEASTSNIRAIYAQRFSQARASTIVSELRVISGDLLPTQTRATVNKEVGQKHWNDILSLMGRLGNGVQLFDGPEIVIDQDPVRVVEGVYTPEDMFYEESDANEDLSDESDDDTF